MAWPLTIIEASPPATRTADVTQLTLPGFDEPQPAPAHHLFFATMPDPATAARIAEMAARFRSEMRVNARPLRTGHLHVTLHDLGNFARLPQATVACACTAAASIDASAFDVTFDRLGSFSGRPGRWPLVLTQSAALGELTAFSQRLGDVLGGAPGGASRAHFTAHLTLLYGERKFEPRAIEPLTWTVRDFVLIDSWLGKTRYVEKGRWPLKENRPLSRSVIHLP
jgi:2'-5' RNA ligase